MNKSNTIDWDNIQNGTFFEGTKEYILQEHLKNRQKILKKYEPITKSLKGLLDYAPLDIELREETKRFKNEINKLNRVDNK